MKVLVLCDDAWHPGEVIQRGLQFLADEMQPSTKMELLPRLHEMEERAGERRSVSISKPGCSEPLTPALSPLGRGEGEESKGGREPQFEFEFISDASQWSPASLNNFPVVIVAKGNHVSSGNQVPWLTSGNQSAFQNFVRNGGGLFAIHGGVCYRDLAEMRGVTGGAFLHHPNQCPVTVEPKPRHALTQGVEAFMEVDEHYQMVLDDPHADVFLRSRSRHGEQPAGWTRTEGSGRVCVLTPGHNPEVWQNKNFQALLRNGLRWLAKLN
jgi:type 1 glutamine amidotransferase